MNAIEVVSLTKKYGSFVAVKDFSFAVKQGEVLGLVGPNGAGKTTTLRALAGIHPPTDGQVRICGFDIVHDAVEAKRRLAFFPDEPRLFDYLTVDEHLEFTAGIYRVRDFRCSLKSARVPPALHALPSALS